jgi:hypothetical protein
MSRIVAPATMDGIGPMANRLSNPVTACVTCPGIAWNALKTNPV